MPSLRALAGAALPAAGLVVLFGWTAAGVLLSLPSLIARLGRRSAQEAPTEVGGRDREQAWP